MKNDNLEPEKYTGKTYAYISAAMTALSFVALGLAFTPLGIYSLIASVLFAIAALEFINVQKKKNAFKQIIYFTAAAYIALAAATLVLAGGIIYSSLKS